MKATQEHHWTEVTHLFEAALEMLPDERNAFLERACAGDEKLRREVQSLLDADAEAGQFMEIPGEQETSTAGATMPSEDGATLPSADALEEPLKPGSPLGRFVVRERLGMGGMGVVYLADDPELSRKIAIKLMRPGAFGNISASEGRARLMREAQAMAQLSHPNVIAVYDVGTLGDQVFIAMEYVGGSTLTHWLAEQKRPWREIVNMFVQTGYGLAAAHAAGILHRDFKPDNVRVGKDGRPRVLDFGLARALFGEPEKRAPDDETATAGTTNPPNLAHFGVALTEPGRLMGTPAYMAPEQLMGQPADHRTDQYSFCVALYQGLYGELPFKAQSIEALVREMQGKAPEAKSSQVPSRLRRAVLRGLRPVPAERYPSMDALLDELVLQATRTRRRLLAVAILGALVAASGLGWYSFVLRRPAPARISIAAADFVNETKDDELNGLSGMLITSLEQSKRLSVLTRGHMFDILKQLGRADAEHIDELLGREICKHEGVNALVLASIRRFGELYAIDLKVIDPVKDKYLFTTKQEVKGKENIPAMIDRIAERTRAELKEKAEEIRAASVAVEKITTANLEAYQHYFQGQQLSAHNDFDKAVPEFRKAVELDPRFALAHLALGDALGWMSDHPAEAKEYEIALRLGLPERERCGAEALLAVSRGKQEELSDECAARFPEEKGLLFNAGDWRFHSADLVGALPYFEKALSIDPNFGPVVEHLIWAWKGLGRADKALELAKAHAARVHEARVHVQLASAQLFAGDKALAIETLREAARLFPESPAPALELANSYLFSGEPEKAESALRPVLEGRFAESDPQFALLARLELEMYRGRFRRAVTAVDNAAADAQKAGDADAISVGLAFWKAFALATGPRDLPAARKIAATALDISSDQLFLLYYLMEDVDRAGAVVEADPYYGLLVAPLLDALRAQRRGDRADASARYEKIAQVPDMRDGALTQLAKLHLDGGEPQKALMELRKLQTTYVGGNLLFLWYPRSFYRMGQAYERAGDPAAALLAYRRFLKLWKDADPDLVELQDAKSRVHALRGLARK